MLIYTVFFKSGVEVHVVLNSYYSHIGAGPNYTPNCILCYTYIHLFESGSSWPVEGSNIKTTRTSRENKQLPYDRYEILGLHTIK